MPGRDLRFSIDRGGTFTDVFVEVGQALYVECTTPVQMSACKAPDTGSLGQACVH